MALVAGTISAVNTYFDSRIRIAGGLRYALQ
jgi:hypothetical protein